MKESKNRNRGFSLVEVLIAIAILTIVTVPLMTTFVTSSKTNQKAKKVQNATEMAQNMFEGINAKTPEEAMIELSALAYTGDPALVDLSTSVKQSAVSVLPGTNYDQVYVCSVEPDPTDPNEDVYTILPPADVTKYVKSVSLEDPVAGKYKFVGFNDKTGVHAYGFIINNYKLENNYYDIRMKLDPSQYTSTYTTYSSDYQYRSNISSVNSKYDSVYSDGASLLENIVSLEYKNKRLNGTLTDSEVLNRLKRTYNITVKNIGTAAAPRMVVDVGIDYLYLRNADLAYGQRPDYVDPEPERIFDSADTGQYPRNIYIYYVPNYSSTTTGSGALDNFVISNLEDLNVNVYIIRTQQANSSIFGTDNSTTSARERSYAATVKVLEGDDSEVNTTLRTNLGEDITKDYGSADRNITPSRITYNVNAASGLRDASLTTSFIDEIRTLESKSEEVRKYDVKIEVYMGKTDNHSDNNGYVNYDGAFVNGWQKSDRLATFTGSLAQ